MGINEMEARGRRISLKRLSRGVEGLRGKLQPKRQSKRRIPSDISDLSSTRGAALRESNALNNEGVRVIDNIAQALEQKLAVEDRLNASDAFSKRKVPSVSLFDYLARLARYINVWRGHAGGAESAGVRAAIMMILYLEKLEELRPEYIVNRRNIHRLCLAGFLVATKFTEDRPISNEFWSRVGGVQRLEVNRLESAFCSLVDFQLFVDDSEYMRYLDLFDAPEF